MASEDEKKLNASRPPSAGIAIVAWFWLVGAALFYAPSYLQISGTPVVILNVLGSLALAISFVGAGVELEKTFRSEAFGYWGVALFFALPAILIHLATVDNSRIVGWSLIGRIVVLFLVVMAGGFVFYGTSFVFRKSGNLKGSEAPAPRPAAERREASVKLIGAIVVALLNLATAILKLIVG